MNAARDVLSLNRKVRTARMPGMRRGRRLLLSFGLPCSILLLSACQTVDRPQLPPPPTARIAPFIGTYGEDASLIDISERSGKLYAEGSGFDDALIVPRGDAFELTDPASGKPVPLEVERDGGSVAALVLAGRRLVRRDPGLEVQDRIRAGVQADMAAIRARAAGMSPPTEPPPERPEELVDLAKFVPGVQLDIRYATTNNFMGVPLYEVPAAFMQKPAAEALGRVAVALRPLGYGIKVFDSYRPWFVTRMFWDATPEASHMFVADPSKGSRHNRGSAVDLTLYRLDTGAEVEMTGRYDEMSLRSYANYQGGTTRQRWERDLLRAQMEQQGFVVYPEEWWHFDFRDWDKYSIMNIPLPELVARQRR